LHCSSFEVARARWTSENEISLRNAPIERIGERDIVAVMNEHVIAAEIQSDERSLRATFDFNGHKVVLDVILDGSNFVSLSSYWSLETDIHSSEILPRINRLNRKFRFVKVQWLPSDGALQLSIEFIARSRADLGAVLMPYLKTLHQAATLANG
jgi:hypothetical protein